MSHLSPSILPVQKCFASFGRKIKKEKKNTQLNPHYQGINFESFVHFIIDNCDFYLKLKKELQIFEHK